MMAYFLYNIDPKAGYALHEGPIRVGEDIYESLLHYWVIHRHYPIDYEVLKSGGEKVGGRVEQREE